MSHLAEKWSSFQVDAVPPGTDQNAAFALKGAFYAGAAVVLLAIGSEGIDFDALLADCREYANCEQEHADQHH